MNAAQLQTGWRRALPNGKTISALGYGCASLFATPSFDEEEAQAILAAALAEGINHFDTSPSYGPMHGERRLGRFIAANDAGRLVITTKVGSNVLSGPVERGFSPDVMRRSFEGSLKRLGVPHVDILYLHGPQIADLGKPVFDFFDALKREGKISYSGVNTFDNIVLDYLRETPIDAAMLQYHAGDLRSENQIARLNAAGKIVISGTALGRARFAWSTFVPRDKASFFYLSRILMREPRSLLDGPRLARRLTATGKPATEAAIQFVTGHPGIVSNLFGTAKPAHARDNARAGQGGLTRDQWVRLAGRHEKA